MNIILIPNPDKPDAMEATHRLRNLLTLRLSAVPSVIHIVPHPTPEQLRECNPSLAIVLGGDGSILATAQALAGMRIPVAGINFGKLGYLAAFSFEEFLEHLDLIVTGNAPKTLRLMLQGAVFPRPHAAAGVATARRGEGVGNTVAGGDATTLYNLAELTAQQPRATGIALNDVVINAGDPFRMIELEIQINQQQTTTFRSDGMIVATASGSTGYNLSAGGPLISPEVEAMVLTSICPHSLSFRPVVLPATASILICPHRLNAGSKVNFDGQLTLPIGESECLLIRRAESPLTLIENPSISHWQMLARKLHWARSPRH